MKTFATACGFILAAISLECLLEASNVLVQIDNGQSEDTDSNVPECMLEGDMVFECKQDCTGMDQQNVTCTPATDGYECCTPPAQDNSDAIVRAKERFAMKIRNEQDTKRVTNKHGKEEDRLVMDRSKEEDE